VEPVAILSSKGKYLWYLLIAIAFVATDALLLTHNISSLERWVSWISFLLFGAGIIIFLRELLDPRPRIVIDDLGIKDRKLGVGLIPWSEITGAYIRSIGGSQFICLSLRQPGMFKRKELNLILSGTNADATELLASILIRVH
jgi:hypothetical protein